MYKFFLAIISHFSFLICILVYNLQYATKQLLSKLCPQDVNLFAHLKIRFHNSTFPHIRKVKTEK